MKTCFTTNIAGYDITLNQRGRDSFGVRYGKQYKAGLNYSDAATELGSCIMHALACESKLDNRHRGEK